MNMKKSIAGVMAGAMAVSAIATTASAWTGGDADQAQIVLSYDLNKQYKAWSAGSATIKYTFAASDVGYKVKDLSTDWTADVVMGAELSNYGNANAVYSLDTVVVTGTGFKQADGEAERATRTFGRKTIVGSDGKNEVVNVGANVRRDAKGNIDAFVVPFTKATNNNGFNMDRFKLNDAPADDTWTVEATVVTGVKDAVTAVVAGTYYVDATHTTTTAPTDSDTDGVFTFAEAQALKTQLEADGYTVTVSLAGGASTDKHIIEITKDGTPAAYVTEKVTFTYKNETDATNKKLEILANQADATPATSEIGKFKGAATVTAPATATGGNVEYGFKAYDVTLNYTIMFPDDVGEWDHGEWELGWGVIAIFDGIDVGGYIGQYAPNFVKPTYGTYNKSMKTNWNEPAEVISRLTDLGYTYPQAVLNDVVANNENVAFTFTTCQHYVDTREYVKFETSDGKGKQAYKWDSQGNPTDYYVEVSNPIGGLSIYSVKPSEIYTMGGTEFIKNPYYGASYDGNKDNDWTGKKNVLWYNPVFTQDLYQKFTWNGNNGYTASGPNGSQGAKDQFGSYASIWNTNLTSAGLVANSRWTMQLSDVDAFEWGDSTVTFFWDAITDEANVTNAANFLTSLQLYTPTEWYWDKLDVAVGAAIAEEVSADATLTETPEEVVDEDTAEVIEDTDEDTDDDDFDDFDFDDTDEDDSFDFDDTDDFDTDDTDEEDTTPDEPAPAVVEVESPKTGNAPVALAVIPVALAAAAVVAKKRK